MKHPELFGNPSANEARKRQSHEWKVVSLRECPVPESLAQINAPDSAVGYWHRHIATAPQFQNDCECVVVLILNTRLRVKGHHFVSVGTLNEAMAHPREVFRIAIMEAAFGIVLMHNHPSGDSDPSQADVYLTRRIREAGKILRIELCDHVIVGQNRHYSFKEHGLL